MFRSLPLYYISLLFVYTSSLALFFPLLFPFFPVVFFAPFLVVCFYRCSFQVSLWWALSCGFIIDLFSSEARFGIYAMNDTLTTLFFYRYKFYFFEERSSTLPILSFGWTFASTLVKIGLLYLTGSSFFLSWEWAMYHLIVIPFQTAIYALIAFTAAGFLVQKIQAIRRHGSNLSHN